MIALVQRVAGASMQVAESTIGANATGLLLLVCAEPAENEVQADRPVDELLKVRLFADNADKMNRSVADVAGALPRDCVKRCRAGRVRAQSAY